MHVHVSSQTVACAITFVITRLTLIASLLLGFIVLYYVIGYAQPK